uniref:UV-stimulated scaffold protein A n=1 Tax=Syphacia muris TaxID=451379 RepID=A0A0N5APB5_9BILA
MENTSELTILRRCVATIIEKFQYTSNELDKKELNEIKHVVRGNCGVIPGLVNSLFYSLQHEECEGRLAVVKICDYLFQRSHAFRVQIINSFKEWLLYTAETDPFHHPLPQPKAVANVLKIDTIKIVKEWYRKFSSAYPKLSSAYHYLRSSKAFDFDRADAQLLAERTRDEELNKRKEHRAALITEEVNARFLEREKDILDCINEVRNALEILVPKFEEEQEDKQQDLPGPSTNNALHAYTCSETISITVPLNSQLIEINETNEAVVQSLMDSIKMLRFYDGLISKWLTKLTKDGNGSSTPVLKKLLDLKSNVGIEMQRYEELKLPKIPRKRIQGSDSESDDFEDVPEKEGLELDFKYENDSLTSYEIERIKQLEGETSSSTRKGMKETTCKTQLPSKEEMIPVLPFGLDLKYWGEDNVKPAEVPRNNSDCHRFWRPSDESDVTTTDGVEAYKSRLIIFSGEEVKYRQCRAPLLDGRLCPRHDKYKCPIHGRIIPRDDMGFPIKEVKDSKSVSKPGVPDDAEYIKDLESATNVQLQAPQCSKSKITKKSPRKKRPTSEAQNVRDRLSAKIFNPRSVKRVTETLDAIRKANAARRFEQQFNYALSRK